MNLIQMFKEIEDYHRTLGYNMRSKDGIDVDGIRQGGLALQIEVTELINSFPWKPWRSAQTQVYDKENAIEEIIDCMFFLGFIMEAGNIDPIDVAAMFDTKLRENYDRIKRGYSEVKLCKSCGKNPVRLNDECVDCRH